MSYREATVGTVGVTMNVNTIIVCKSVIITCVMKSGRSPWGNDNTSSVKIKEEVTTISLVAIYMLA